MQLCVAHVNKTWPLRVVWAYAALGLALKTSITFVDNFRCQAWQVAALDLVSEGA